MNERDEETIGSRRTKTPSVKEARAAATATPGPSNDATGKDGVGATKTFTLDYTDKRGHRWEGEFGCHVLTIRERVQVGLMKSRLAGGLPPQALDPLTDSILEMQSHLAFALDKRPEWAADEKLEGFRDVNLIEAIYKEVIDHEGRFWGADES